VDNIKRWNLEGSEHGKEHWFCTCMAFLDNLFNYCQRTLYRGSLLRCRKKFMDWLPPYPPSPCSALHFVFLQQLSHSVYKVSSSDNLHSLWCLTWAAGCLKCILEYETKEKPQVCHGASFGFLGIVGIKRDIAGWSGMLNWEICRSGCGSFMLYSGISLVELKVTEPG
jgi:hypothetical protein